MPGDLVGYIAGFVATAPGAVQRLANLRSMANVNRRFNSVIRQNRSTLIQPHLDTLALSVHHLQQRVWNASDERGENGDYGSDLDC